MTTITNLLSRRARRATLLAGLTLAAGAAVPVAGASAATLVVDDGVPAATAGVAPGGSYLRLAFPGFGYLTNDASSNTVDKTFTPLDGNASGGLTTGSFQGVGGNILTPVNWGPSGGAPFDVYTVGADPTGQKTGTFPTPQLQAAGDATDDLRSWTIRYAGTFRYNQGADATNPPNLDRDLDVDYDAITGEIELDWTSQINGDTTFYPTAADDPFNGAVGEWHIEGTL